MIDHFNIIEALDEQIYSLLDLIICADKDCVDIKNIQCAADMIETMQIELMMEIKKIEEKWQNANKNDKQS